MPKPTPKNGCQRPCLPAPLPAPAPTAQHGLARAHQRRQGRQLASREADQGGVERHVHQRALHAAAKRPQAGRVAERVNAILWRAGNAFGR